MKDVVEPKEVDRDYINTLAGETLSVFRINLVILALFLTVVGLVFSEATAETILAILASPYTLTGLLLLLGSMMATALLYFRIRQVGTREKYPDVGVLNDERILSYSVVASVIASAFGVIALFLGMLDGPSQSVIPVTDLWILILPLSLVMAIFGILSLPESAVIMKGRLGSWLDEKDYWPPDIKFSRK